MILYTAHIKNDIFSISIEEQEKRCKDSIEQRGWKIKYHYTDTLVDDIEISKRTGISPLFENIQDKRDYVLVINSLSVLGTDTST